MNNLDDIVTDFIASEHFLLFSGEAREYAEPLLHHFCSECHHPTEIAAVEKALYAMLQLDIPVSAKKGLPDLVSEFFHYCSSSGKYPVSSASWEEYPVILKPEFLKKFRDDGSLRGTTFVKKYSGTGRNDPCPCGSGRKFKKCCGKR